MDYITPRESSNLDRFHRYCVVQDAAPEEERRRLVARESALKFMWAVALLSLFGFFSLLGWILS